MKLRSIVYLALVAVLAAVSLSYAAPKEYPEISQADLQAAIQAGKVTLIDCNGTHSYKEHHIPGAINFAADQGHLAQLLPADKNALIVSYCANPKCPMFKDGADAAQALGYHNIRHFAPGIQGWIQAGGKTQSAN